MPGSFPGNRPGIRKEGAETGILGTPCGHGEPRPGRAGGLVAEGLLQRVFQGACGVDIAQHQRGTMPAPPAGNRAVSGMLLLPRASSRRMP